jgi:hypothetical protein
MHSLAVDKKLKVEETKLLRGHHHFPALELFEGKLIQ